MHALMDALDTYIPEPERAVDGAFLMPVEDVFLDLRSRDGCDGPSGAREGTRGRGGGDCRDS